MPKSLFCGFFIAAIFPLFGAPIYEATRVVELDDGEDIERVVLSDERRALVRVSDGGYRDCSYLFDLEDGLKELDPGLLANDMSEYGVVVGGMDTRKGRVPVRYDDGTLTLLRCPEGCEGEAVAITDDGWVLCLGADEDERSVTWLWAEGRPPEILSSDNRFCRDIYGFYMSEDGVIAGVVENSRGDRQAFRYTDGDGIELLGEIGPFGSVSGISRNGSVIGYTQWQEYGSPQAFYRSWDQEMFQLMDFGGDVAQIFDFDGEDTMVGYAADTNGNLKGACYSSEGDLKELSGPYGDEIQAVGMSINEQREVAGGVLSPAHQGASRESGSNERDPNRSSFVDRLRSFQPVVWLEDHPHAINENLASKDAVYGIAIAINSDRDLLVLGVRERDEKAALWWMEMVDED